jgi:two-component system chemotaxis sensor kinase CheA
MTEDPLKYFRIEARELSEALTGGALELERDRGGKEPVERLLRIAHTLKGGARVVGITEIADLAHAIEDALAPHRSGQGNVASDRIEMVVTLVQAVAKSVAALDAARPARPRQGSSPEVDGAGRPHLDFETVRVEVVEMDALLEGVAETTVQVGAFRGVANEAASTIRDAGTLIDRLDHAATVLVARGAEEDSLAQARALAVELRANLLSVHRRLLGAADRALREIAQVRERTDKLRLIPAGLVFDSLERSARDAASQLGRTIEFETSGGDIRLDQPVLSALNEGLLHVVRNAVAHGIESPEERVASGKPSAGRIELKVERRRGRVAVTCSDDGRGVDVHAVRRAAVARGILNEEQASALGMDEAIRLLRRGGLSTAQSVSQIAGRGVGMQVLSTVAEQFKGQLDVSTAQGRGTTIAITVPVSLTSVPALVAEVSDVVVALPRDAVSSTVRMRHGDIVRSSEGETIVWEGRAVPFAPLARILGLPSAPKSASALSNVVLIQNESSVVAVGVDRILGLYPLVVRTLPRATGSPPTVAGASLDAEGNPWLVLDAAGIIRAARASGPGVSTAEPAPRLPILVIDDSLTTRMLERTILETAGYEVDIATSGEEGLAKAEVRRYGVFIVDVEMPGIDGFEFVRRTRADHKLRDTPAILVTSLNSPEHKRKGLEAGARGYIVKGEFDELALLGMIRNLIG